MSIRSLNQRHSMVPVEAGTPSMYERIFMMFVFIFGARSFIDLFYGGDALVAAENDDGFIVRALWVVIYCITFFFMFRRVGIGKIAYVMKRMPYPFILAGLALLSVVWSVAPGDTLNRSISLLGTVLVGVYFGIRFSPKEQLSIMGWFFVVFVVLNALTALLIPSYGTMRFSPGSFYSPDAWKGITTHKNNLGPLITLGAAYFISLIYCQREKRWTYFALLVLTSYVAVKSQSSTGMLMMGVCIATIFIIAMGRTFKFGYLPMFILISGIFFYFSYLFVVGSEIIVESLGKDLTFTGRTFIWDDAFGIIKERPITGFGFKVVWGKKENSLLPEFLTTTEVNHAHNGYLSVATELGVIALAITIFYLVVSIVRSVHFLMPDYNQYPIFVTIFFMRFYVGNVMETNINVQQNLEWILFIAFTTSLYFWKSAKH